MTENDAIVASGSPENSEPLEFLRELIGDGLQRNDVLFRSASIGVVDLLENSIRVGFYLQDAKAYLAGDGKFVKWVEENFKISYARANQLHRLSKHFSRDLMDSQQRERLGITPKGLDCAIGPHVRNQITSTGAQSLSELFRVTGILPPLAIHAGNGQNGNGDHAQTKFKAFSGLLQSLEKRSLGIDPARLSQPEKTKLAASLKPLAELYQALTGTKPEHPVSSRFCSDDFR